MATGHGNDTLIASGRLTINPEADLKSFFSSLIKGLVHLKSGDAVGALDSFVDLSGSFSFNNSLARLSFKLFNTAINKAIQDVADTFYDSLFYDSERQFAVSCAFDDAVIPESFSFDKSSIDDPCGTDFYKGIEGCIISALKKLEIEPAITSAVEKNLRKSFTLALQSEWREGSTEYRKLEEFFSTPFDSMAADEKAWDMYAEKLRGNIKEPLFGEPYSLSDIFTPINAYYRDKAENSARAAERQPEHRYVQDLNELLEKWLASCGSDDMYRVISGDPGSGKSAFTKKFAADHINSMRVVYVPLDRLGIEGQFNEQFSKFAKTEGLPADILEKEKKLLIILDGLDELTALGQAAANASYRFVYNVRMTVDQINRDGRRVYIIISGRVPSVQEADGLFSDNQRQLLHLLPYYMPENKRSAEINRGYSYEDPKSLLPVDYRKQWWSKYAAAKNATETGAEISEEIPEELLSEDLDELTSSPLLLHLMAICYADSGVIPQNRAELYEILLEGVYNRAPGRAKTKNRHPLTNIFTDSDEFISVLSDVALAMWHNSGRQVTLETVESYCISNNHEPLLKKLAEAAGGGGALRLFMAFYSRRADNIGGKEAFEFTHKSFGEYLVARRIVEMLADINKKLNDEKLRTIISEQSELERWLALCGPTALEFAQVKLIRDLVALYKPKTVKCWQPTVLKLLTYIVNNGYPTPRERSPIKEELRRTRNAETALLVLHSACAKVTRKVGKIDWRDDGGLIKIWLKGLQYSDENLYLINKNLNYLDFSGCDLEHFSFDYADLTGSVFRNTYLRSACFDCATIKDTVFNNCNLDNTDWSNMISFGSVFEGCSISLADFEWVDFFNVKFINCNLSFSDFRFADLSHLVDTLPPPNSTLVTLISCQIDGVLVYKESYIYNVLGSQTDQNIDRADISSLHDEDIVVFRRGIKTAAR